MNLRSNRTDKPRVSVCIPCYNHADYIGAAIESVLAQTYADWELVIVDDASPDATPDILKDYQARYPDRIRLILLERNGGISAAVNTYLDAAQGEFIACLSSDDMMMPERLAKQVAHLDSHAGTAAVCSLVTCIDAQGTRIRLANDVFSHPIENLRLQLLEGNFLNGPSMMVRTEVFRQVGHHNPALDYVQDYDFWLRLLDEHEIDRLDESLTAYRLHGNNQSVFEHSNVPFAARYETAVVAFQTIARWPVERIFELQSPADTPSRQVEVARCKARLAHLCIHIDKACFGRPFLGLAHAYELIVEARGLAPGDARIEKALHTVYGLLGDEPRAQGGKSIPLVEWQTQSFPAAGSSDVVADTYSKWVEQHALTESDAQVMAERMMTQWRSRPSIQIVTLVSAGQEQGLADTLDSLQEQLYGGWGLTVIAEQVCPVGTVAELPMVEWLVADDDPMVLLGEAVRSTQADWVLMLAPGDRLAPEALFACVDYLQIHPEWQVIYADHDSVDATGNHFNPAFKPDFNLDLLRSTDYVGGFCAFRRETLESAGGYRGWPALAAYDAVLRVLDSQGETVIGHIAEVLVNRAEQLTTRAAQQVHDSVGRQCVSDHLARCGIEAEVGEGLQPGTWRVEYAAPDQPLVSVIIPTRDRLDLLQPCIESLFDKTTYPNFEVLVVNNDSQEHDAQRYLQSLSTDYPGRVRVLDYPEPFNFSAMNNIAAAEAQGEYLLLLNNDTRIVQANWLERMLNHARRPDVGAVGARLVLSDQTLQHAGVVAGMQEGAGHLFLQQPMSTTDAVGRGQCDQNYSAVTAACLLIDKQLYHDVGGLDAERFRVSYNDVDFCLTLAEQGYRTVWTPYATLVHHSSATQLENSGTPETHERFVAEQQTLLDAWLPQLAHDPAWNRNMSLTCADGRADADFVCHWDVNFHARPRVLGYPINATGCGAIRVLDPLARLADAAEIEYGLVPPFDCSPQPRVPSVTELARLDPDILLLQTTVNDAHLEAIGKYQRHSHALRVCDMEDLKTIVPEKNSRKAIMFPDMEQRIERLLSMCDRLVVTTEPLIEAHRHMIDDIRVVPNYLPRSRWGGLTSLRRQGKKPRVGWVGAQQHQGDLEVLIDVVKATAGEVDWVFFGMCIEELKPHIAEFHGFVHFNDYAPYMASLNLDLAVAPLEQHPFNEAKSNLRLLEYGLLGWPVVCTDIFPYQGAPVKCVPNDSQAWIEAIRERVNDLDAAAREGDRLRQWVQENWILEDHLDVWMAALTGAQSGQSRAVKRA